MNGIRHIGIYVKNLESMISFYKDVFDVNVIIQQNENGMYIDTVFNENGVDIEVCKLEFANKTILELIHYVHANDFLNWKDKIYRCGKMHIAITVDSAQKIYQILKARRCEVLSEPCDSPYGKVKMFFARDIEGNYLELVEEL